MQVIATGKTPAWGRVLHQLNCFFPKHRQAVRVMKLITIIILTGCLQLSARGLSQTISITVKDAPLLTVLKAIEKQTDFVFIVDNQWLQKTKKVTLTANNLPLQKVLELCFRDQPLTYNISGKVIVISPKEEKAKPINAVNQEMPPIDVKGRVVNENGEPVAATVTIKGTNRGTSTNQNGEFHLTDVDDDAVLVITGVGVEAKELKVNGSSNLNVVVKIAVKPLDEVQMIAYGTTTKRFNTGNVSSVKAVDIQRQPVNNPLLALEGRVPGLFITQNTGIAGGGITVRIQGQNSILRGNDPLYVIDGVPYISQMLPDLLGPSGILGNNGNTNSGSNGGGGNPLSFLNPLDIESIEVLKDADATAIYGSRGANGVILITTKKGKAGQNKVDLMVQAGWGKVNHFLDLLDKEQYLAMRHEAKQNDGAGIRATDYDLNGTWDTTRYTDWQKVLMGGAAQYLDGHLNFSGGSSTTKFLLGGGFHRETSVFPGDFNDQKASLLFNLSQTSLNQKFNLQFSGSYLIDDNKLPTQDLTNIAINLPPIAPPLYNDDGTLNWAPTSTGTSSWLNPLTYSMQKYNRKANNLISNALLGYKILNSLDVKLSLGYTNLTTNEFYKLPLGINAPELLSSSVRISFFGDTKIETYLAEPMLEYKLKVQNNSLNILLGSSFQQVKSDEQQIYANGFTNDLVMEDPKSAPINLITGTLSSKYKYSAAFARINYNLSDKYLLNLSGRRDGSSRFGPKNSFHNFWAVGAAWILSNENFFPKKSWFISFAKLRASYGESGNDQIGDYQFLNLYNAYTVPTPYQGAIGFLPNRLYNPYLQWEETKKMQAGIDVAILNERIVFYVNYFRNRSSNQLQQYALPYITGFNNIVENFPATVQNTGVEVSLNTRNIVEKHFRWETTITFTQPKNKLVSYKDLEKSSFANSLVIGQPLSNGKLFNFAKVDPATGLFTYYDADGNLTSNPTYTKDQTVLNVLFPKFYGGLQNTIQFKNFEFDFFFQFTKEKGPNYLDGNQPGRFSSSPYGASSGNQPVSVLDRWQKPGDNSSIQKFSASYNSTVFGNSQNAIGASTFTYADASFVKLKNFSLSYILPEKWLNKIHFYNAKVFINGQNLFTITNYTGLDPETLSLTSLPPLRIIAGGVSISL